MLSRGVRHTNESAFLISHRLCIRVRVPSIYVCVCVCSLFACKLVRVKKGSDEMDEEEAVKSIFNSLKEESVERRKKLIWRIMLRVNIFFMLFEKLFVRDKRVIVVDAIDFFRVVCFSK